MKLGKFELDKIYLGDCKNLLKQLPDEKIDMCITSPPYWGLRDYGIEGIIWDGDENCEHIWETERTARPNASGGQNWDKLKTHGKDNYSEYVNYKDRATYSNFCSKCGAWKGQLGLEPDFNLYIKHLCDIFDEVKRVLKKEGTCWVNIGDTYGGSGNASGHTEYTKNLGYITSKMGATKGHTKNIMAKSLIMIPFRFAIEMVNRGWTLRNTIIWHKPNCMPSSVKDRFTVDFEYLFFFSKSKKYYFEQQFESYSESYLKDKRPIGVLRHRLYPNSKYVKAGMVKLEQKSAKKQNYPKGRNKRTVWKIRSKYNQAEGHSNRAGLQREPTLREKRINEIIQKEIANYLRKYVTKESKNILDKEFGEHKWPHWIRTDESGASLPSPNDWIQLKEILNFDNRYDDIMTETEIYLDDGMMWKNKGKNKRAVWSITTRGFKEAHFAVFPPKLIETPIKAGCPEFVCKKCGKAREKLFDYKRTPTRPEPTNSKYGDKENDIRGGDGIRLRKEVKHIFKGYTNCNCNAGFEGGIVLDPFIGSGTVGKVVIKQRKHFIGFEINPEYVEMANRRLANIQVSML